MLHNPKWDKTTNPFAINTLILWLEQQPADKSYCYLSTGECLLAQYFTAMGFEGVRMYAVDFHYDGGAHDLPRGFDSVAVAKPQTFGAALQRARALG